MKSSSVIMKAIDFIASLSLVKVAVFGLVLTAGYFFLIYDSGAQLNQTIESSKALWEVESNKKIETNKVLKKEQQMKSNVALFVKKFEEIKSKIPIEFTESELREIVTQFANRNNLINKSSSRPTPSYKNTTNKLEDNLIERVELSYTFEGTYSGIAQFVTDLSHTDKVIKIGDFIISEPPPTSLKREKKSAQKLLIFNATIIGYKQYLAPANGNKKTL